MFVIPRLFPGHDGMAVTLWIVESSILKPVDCTSTGLLSTGSVVRTIALTGKSGGKIKSRNLADITICVPDDETFRIQELHLPVYHMLCIAAENEFFGD